jgi:DNA invertase Pin-like site-specific DNA recombinase
LSLQREVLERAGCTAIREEKVSGTSRKGRSELQILMEFLRKGDTLMVTRIDRLARSMKDLQDIVHELKAKGVALKATEQPIDTGSAAGKAFLDMLGVFARVRDEPPAPAPDGRHRQGEGGGRLQRPTDDR